MAVVKLNKGLSYIGHGVRANTRDPYVDTDDKTAAALIASGFFVAVEGEPDPVPPQTPPTGTITVYSTWNLAQLKAFAKEHDIDVAGLKTKQQYVDRISEAMRKPEPEVDGSLAMIALQEG